MKLETTVYIAYRYTHNEGKLIADVYKKQTELRKRNLRYKNGQT